MGGARYFWIFMTPPSETKVAPNRILGCFVCLSVCSVEWSSMSRMTYYILHASLLSLVCIHHAYTDDWPMTTADSRGQLFAVVNGHQCHDQYPFCMLHHFSLQTCIMQYPIALHHDQAMTPHCHLSTKYCLHWSVVTVVNAMTYIHFACFGHFHL